METVIGVNEVAEMARQMKELGIGIVAVAIIFILFLGIVTTIFTSMMKTQQKRQEEYDEMLKHILNSKREPAPQPQREGDIFSSSLEIEKAIDERLKFACGSAKSDRAAVYVFHNGTRTLGGSHLLKFSCLTEYANIYQHYANGKHQGIPTGRIKDVCNNFLSGKFFSSWDVSKMSDDSPTKEWLVSQGIKSTVASPIYAGDGSVIGFVTLDYLLDLAPSDTHKNIAQCAERLASKMSILVDLNLVHEKSPEEH